MGNIIPLASDEILWRFTPTPGGRQGAPAPVLNFDCMLPRKRESSEGKLTLWGNFELKKLEIIEDGPVVNLKRAGELFRTHPWSE
ncbi:MAG: hypothetical protein ACLSHU_03760 [Oscillospiraceae bacterium]